MASRRFPVLFGVFAALLVLFCVSAADYREARDAQNRRIEAWLAEEARELEESLHQRLHLVWGLEAFVRMNPGFTEEEFLRFAGALEKRWEGIRSLQLAPDAVVTYLTQPELNEKARGHDLLADEARRPAVLRAIENDEYIIAGPINLIQGGIAIIGRMPVYIPVLGASEEQFWGFATILLDVEVLLDSGGLLDRELGFDIALRGKHGLGEDGDVFFGDAAVFEGASLKAKVTLPNGSWILAAKSKTVWPSHWAGRYELWSIGIALSIAAGLLIFGLLRWPHRLKEEVRRSTRALAASRQQYRQLAHIAPTGIYHSDADGNIIFANDRFREIVGTEAADITGDDWDAMVHPDDRVEANEEWDNALKSGISHCEYRFLHRDGRVVWVLDQAMKLEEDEEGNTSTFVGTMTDITELKSINAELEDARREATAASAAKSEFLASVSHEIRTPLNGILGMVRVMKNAAPDEETRAQLKIVEHSSDTLLDLLNDVLDFSQIQAGKLEINAEPFSVDTLVNDVTELWRPRAEEKGLQMVASADIGTASTRLGDAKRIRQVLSNLISNAIKFTDQGQVEIAVTACSRESSPIMIEFAVSDTGMGIEAADQRVIFDKFTQADSAANRRYDGTGLGLAICKELTDLMGGSITVESAPGDGSTFTVVLPCPEATEQSLEAHPEEKPDAWEDPGGGIHILLAEDNLINQHVVAAMLDQPGYSLDIVCNGREAVDQVRVKAYDVVLMDIRMPELDGVSASQEIRSLSGAAARVPIIALTANSGDNEWDHYRAAGMTAWVTKPIDPHKLVTAIRQQIDDAGEGVDCGWA